MESRVVKIVIVLLFVMSAINTTELTAQQQQGAQQQAPRPQGLTLTSTAFPDGGEIPPKYAGQQGVSPALAWTHPPAGTVEYVLVMNDPEPVRPAGAATGDILHWMVVKIPGTATSLPEGAGAANSTTLPAGARQVRAYGGPGAPASGPHHHYTLTLYALNAPLNLAADADRAAVMAAMEGKVLGRGIYVGRFMQAPAR
jgi:Raf kinase inhibitor-like YbhB/YbcL family protein